MGPAALIGRLQLIAHPEGGWYRETWRASQCVDTPRGPRSAGTSILYLLCDGAVSHLHRIASDEVWYHQAGPGLTVEVITPDGEHRSHHLGLDEGRQPQAVVPAGAWFGARCDHTDAWALVGCTVAPGFDFADFELADRHELARLYPQHLDLIMALTRE